VNELESVVAEIAGRDSVAAILKYCQSKRSVKIFPTYVHAPTEHGDFSIIENNVDDLGRALDERYSVKLENLIVMENPRLWGAINGRFISLFVKNFGFYSPCLGCHLYMHIMRAPLAFELESRKMISGERESHSGEIKLNQTAKAIDAYIEVLKSAGIELVLPIREIAQNAEIEKVVGKDWKASEKQMECVLSGNYRESMPSEDNLDKYLNKFLIPVGKRLVAALLEKNDNYLEIVKETLGE
jgi:hypothetical protein